MTNLILAYLGWLVFRFLLFSSYSLGYYYLFGSIVSGLNISPPKEGSIRVYSSLELV
jgi:hypothetical protein